MTVEVFFYSVQFVVDVLLVLGVIIHDLFKSIDAFSQLANGIAKSMHNASI